MAPGLSRQPARRLLTEAAAAILGISPVACARRPRQGRVGELSDRGVSHTGRAGRAGRVPLPIRLRHLQCRRERRGLDGLGRGALLVLLDGRLATCPSSRLRGGKGTGSGTLRITIGPHSSAGLRSGSATVSGYPYAIVITQQGCTYGVSPLAIGSVASAGGPATVTIAANGLACSWAVASHAPFVVTTSGSSGTGGGTVTLAIAPHAGAARTGTVTVEGHTVTVTQAGAIGEAGPDQECGPIGIA